MVDWDAPLIGAVCIVCVLAALTMPAGIGGGILFVPVLRLVAGLDQKHASAMSQVLITGASTGSIVFQILWQMRHKSEPLLAQPYFVTFMMPALVAGSLVGIYLSRLLPQTVSVVVLVCLCIVSSVMIFRKAIATYRRENLVKQEQACSAANTPTTAQLSVLRFPTAPMDRGVSMASLEAGLNIAPELGMYESIDAPRESFLYEDSVMISPPNSIVSLASLRSRRMSIIRSESLASTPSSLSEGSLSAWVSVNLFVRKPGRVQRVITKTITRFVAFVVLYWVFLLIFTLLRGSRSGIPPCGTAYWVITGTQLGVGCCLAVLVAHSEIRLISQTFLTGIVATLSGASGGIIVNPTLMNRGLDPQQTSATSTIIMFVMASTSALEYLTNGTLDPDAAYLMLVTLFGSVVGMTFVSWFIKKLGRQSLLVFLLGGLVVLGGGMLVYIGTSDLVSDISVKHSPFTIGELCS